MKLVQYDGPYDQLEQAGRILVRGEPTEVPNDFPVSKVKVLQEDSDAPAEKKDGEKK